MRKKSLKLRITLWYSLFMMVIIVALGVSVWVVINHNSEDQIKSELKNAVEAAAAEMDGTRTTDIRELLDNSVDGHYIAVYSEDDQMLAGIEPQSDEKSVYNFSDGVFQTKIFQSEVYYVYDKKVAMDDGDLWVRGYIHVMGQTDYLALVERILLIALPIVFIIMIAGGWILTKRALRPLEQMEEDAADISSGDDLEKRLSLENSYDEMQNLGLTINEMLERLQNSFDTERQFISDASHELRTPISVILMQCESYDEDSDLEEYEMGNALVMRQTEKMRALVENLLQLSRLSNKMVPREMESCDMESLLHELVEEQQMIHEDVIYKEEVSGNVTVNCNLQLLERAIVNLLDNAYKYGGTHIILSVNEIEDHIKISVTDNGLGMKQEELDKIWNRFYQVDKSRSGEHGFGLGLSLVKSIVDIHHGTIEVESSFGEGSTFSIILPKN